MFTEGWGAFYEYPHQPKQFSPIIPERNKNSYKQWDNFASHYLFGILGHRVFSYVITNAHFEFWVWRKITTWFMETYINKCFVFSDFTDGILVWIKMVFKSEMNGCVF